MPYLWEQKEWPRMTWNEELLTTPLAITTHEQGRMQGQMEALGFDFKNEARLITLTEDVVNSSDIEGEHLDPNQVRSSIARRLGMDIAGLVEADRQVEGIVEMTLDATTNFDAKLDEERLFAWHSSLFPTGRSGMVRINVGSWRDDRNQPMQVVSGPMGRERVHFQAPPANRVEAEMANFLHWFESPSEVHPLFIAGLAHLWFLTIHPFEDGNGRIARAIADMALARSEKSIHRCYSMSSQIRRERRDYYQILEWTQKGPMDVTQWMEWFLGCLLRSIKLSQKNLDIILTKAEFWSRFATVPLNHRQIKVMNKLLDGFEGKLTSSKWARIAKCSQDTATRDINDLIDRGGLCKDPAGGRSTSYSPAITKTK
ncbi:MAG: Fic family protein [Gammaproteobacteria bacterium]|nr:Fic family protein [Gammaproteobacteria bacterium]